MNVLAFAASLRRASIHGSSSSSRQTRIPLEGCGALVFPDMFALPRAALKRQRQIVKALEDESALQPPVR